MQDKNRKELENDMDNAMTVLLMHYFGDNRYVRINIQISD